MIAEEEPEDKHLGTEEEEKEQVSFHNTQKQPDPAIATINTPAPTEETGFELRISKLEEGFSVITS